MKIMIAQITTDAGRIEENTAKIISTINMSKKSGADLVVFPELAIPGYMPLDLMLNSRFIDKNLAALKKVIKQTKGISVIVGFIDTDKKKIGPDETPLRYNSAAIITDGKLVGVEDKTLLPDYDIFYETRYFASARKRGVYEINGVKVGIEICEDLWDKRYDIKVSEDLISQGARLLINISASPFYIGKRKIRENLIKQVVKKHHVPFVYANMVGGQDGYEGELVFDGQSMVFDANASLVAYGKAFNESFVFADLENPGKYLPPKSSEVQDLLNALVLGTKEYFKRTGFRKAVVGLSGGIDSALVAAIAVQALGKENVLGVAMPSKFSSKGSVEDAKELSKNLGIDFDVIPIEKTFNALKKTLVKKFKGLAEDVTEENMQARIRGMILMSLSNKFGVLVLSTGNKTETALGYTTLYGDMCGGLAVISDVSKLRVYELARFINIAEGKVIIPESTLTKSPSAELRPGQTDEESLGSYALVSPLVDEIVENSTDPKILVKKYPAKLIDKMTGLINRAEYKRRQAPPGIKVTKKSFGIGRRFPISHGFRD